MAKYAAAEAGVHCVDQAIQTHGGNGFALEYGLTGKKPADALPSLEIYDTAAPSGQKLPGWLKETTFSGGAQKSCSYDLFGKNL